MTTNQKPYHSSMLSRSAHQDSCTEKKENLELPALGCQRGELAVPEADEALGILPNPFSSSVLNLAVLLRH